MHVHHKAWRARQRPDPTEEIIWDDGFYNNSQDTIETQEKVNRDEPVMLFYLYNAFLPVLTMSIDYVTTIRLRIESGVHFIVSVRIGSAENHDDKEKKEDGNISLVIIIVLASLLILGLLVICFYVCRRRFASKAIIVAKQISPMESPYAPSAYKSISVTNPTGKSVVVEKQYVTNPTRKPCVRYEKEKTVQYMDPDAYPPNDFSPYDYQMNSNPDTTYFERTGNCSCAVDESGNHYVRCGKPCRSDYSSHCKQWQQPTMHSRQYFQPSPPQSPHYCRPLPEVPAKSPKVKPTSNSEWQPQKYSSYSKANPGKNCANGFDQRMLIKTRMDTSLEEDDRTSDTSRKGRQGFEQMEPYIDYVRASRCRGQRKAKQSHYDYYSDATKNNSSKRHFARHKSNSVAELMFDSDVSSERDYEYYNKRHRKGSRYPSCNDRRHCAVGMFPVKMDIMHSQKYARKYKDKNSLSTLHPSYGNTHHFNESRDKAGHQEDSQATRKLYDVQDVQYPKPSSHRRHTRK